MIAGWIMFSPCVPLQLYKSAGNGARPAPAGRKLCKAVPRSGALRSLTSARVEFGASLYRHFWTDDNFNGGKQELLFTLNLRSYGCDT